MMSSIATKEFIYYLNDGVMTRANPSEGVFEVRNFQTGRWVTTNDQRLVEKMHFGLGALESQEKSNDLFRQLQARVKKSSGEE